MIIKAFQDGAVGVCLLGCPEEQCRYQTGNQLAERVYQETKQLLNLLGYSKDQLQYHRIPAAEGERFNEILGKMLRDIVREREGT
jgi:coenzyme F420-reducing hydrogenase delta subunit